MRVILDADRPLEGAELAPLRDLVKRRRVYEPIAYLRGEREFYGLKFRVDKRVLVPRPDTETLVDVALARSAHVSMSMRQLDLCTGSGCVAIAMARQRPTAQVFGSDISPDALAVARENALRLGAYNVAFFESDLFAAFAGKRFDVITANPPYIASAEIADAHAGRSRSRAAARARRRRGRARARPPHRGGGARAPRAGRPARDRGRRRRGARDGRAVRGSRLPRRARRTATSRGSSASSAACVR